MRDRTKMNSGTCKGDDETGWHEYLEDARAVLIALREPSEGMLDAGTEIIRHVQPAESEFAQASDAANVWRFMIDAALEDR